MVVVVDRSDAKGLDNEPKLSILLPIKIHSPQIISWTLLLLLPKFSFDPLTSGNVE